MPTGEYQRLGVWLHLATVGCLQRLKAVELAVGRKTLVTEGRARRKDPVLMIFWEQKEGDALFAFFYFVFVVAPGGAMEVDSSVSFGGCWGGSEGFRRFGTDCLDQRLGDDGRRSRLRVLIREVSCHTLYLRTIVPHLSLTRSYLPQRRRNRQGHRLPAQLRYNCPRCTWTRQWNGS